AHTYPSSLTVRNREASLAAHAASPSPRFRPPDWGDSRPASDGFRMELRASAHGPYVMGLCVRRHCKPLPSAPPPDSNGWGGGGESLAVAAGSQLSKNCIRGDDAIPEKD
ncbi:unnamed protein product, partial [Urochloa humidicola]